MIATEDNGAVPSTSDGRATASDRPLLTIGVPTYNRRPYLQRCIESIRASIARCEAGIELLISDNASSDDTQAYLSDLAIKASAGAVRVMRQVENIGAERNFRALTTAATGRFIWVIGDDDLLEPDAVPMVTRRILEGASCIICNYSVWDKELTCVISARGLKLPNDLRMTSKDEVMRVFGLNLGYISSVVIERRLSLMLDDAEYKSFTSYGFPFMYAAYVGLGVECDVSYIAAPVVVNRSGNSGGYDWYRYFVQGSCLIFDRLVTRFGYERLSVNAAKTRTIHQYVVRELAARRLSGADITGIPSLLFENYWFLPSFWLLLVPIMLMPRRVVGSTRELARRLR